MTYNNKKVIVSVINHSPCENNNELELFLSNLEQLLNHVNKRKSSLHVIAWDFNARSSSWWANDTNITEGSKLYSLTSSNEFSQLINEPTKLL